MFNTIPFYKPKNRNLFMLDKTLHNIEPLNYTPVPLRRRKNFVIPSSELPFLTFEEKCFVVFNSFQLPSFDGNRAYFEVIKVPEEHYDVTQEVAAALTMPDSGISVSELFQTLKRMDIWARKSRVEGKLRWKAHRAMSDFLLDLYIEGGENHPALQSYQKAFELYPGSFPTFTKFRGYLVNYALPALLEPLGLNPNPGLLNNECLRFIGHGVLRIGYCRDFEPSKIVLPMTWDSFRGLPPILGWSPDPNSLLKQNLLMRFVEKMEGGEAAWVSHSLHLKYPGAGTFLTPAQWGKPYTPSTQVNQIYKSLTGQTYIRRRDDVYHV